MRSLIYLICIISIFTSCKEDSSFEFDRTALLTEIAENNIIPNYTQLYEDLSDVRMAVEIFQGEINETNLNNLKSHVESAYISFQRVKMFEFGPAGDFGFARAMNTYPTDSVQIKSNINSGSYSLVAVSNVAAIGLPAVDYLLNGESDEGILNAFSSDEFAENRMTYLIDLCEKMKSECFAILNSWNSSYKTTFIEANGTTISSSLSVLFNQFVVDLELVKNAKIGIPSGQFSGGEPFPSYVENFYAGQSKNLALTNLLALKAVFTGGTGIGMDDYMDASVEHGITAIPSSEITAQFDVCIARLESLNDPFSATIPSNPSDFTEAFQELKKLVAYAKTDIPAALGVLISFSDTDGD